MAGPPEGPVPKSLEDARAFFLDYWRQQQKTSIATPPPAVYHYTDVLGLASIIRTNELWATNAAYTNDQTEVVHALRLLRVIVDEDSSDRATNPTKDSMLVVAEEFDSIIETFIVCFCKDGDLLSQWRGYGKVGGYSLGFETTALQQFRSSHVALVPVVYEDSEQDRLLRQLVGHWRAVFKPSEQEATRQVRRLGAFVFAQAFSILAATFKNRGFAEEHEWRLVYLRQRLLADDGSGFQVRFRAMKGMMTPYTPMQLAPINENAAPRLPLSEIVMGPTTNARLAGHGLMRFLQSLGYPDASVPIRESTVPLRA
jgi:hypothetical protein